MPARFERLRTLWSWARSSYAWTLIAIYFMHVDLWFHLPCLRVGWRASRVLHMPVLEVGRETMPLPSDGIHELYDNARSLLSKGCVHKVAMLIHWFAHKPTPHTQTCSAGPRDSNARGHVTQVGCRCCSASSTAKCLHVLRDSGR